MSLVEPKTMQSCEQARQYAPKVVTHQVAASGQQPEAEHKRLLAAGAILTQQFDGMLDIFTGSVCRRVSTDTKWLCQHEKTKHVQRRLQSKTDQFCILTIGQSSTILITL